MKKKFEDREAIVLLNQGEKIFGVLHLPLSQDPCPLVMMCSGFAATKTGRFRILVNLSTELAQQGIASFRFDYRGAGDSEGDYDDLTLENNFSDAHLCLDHLSRHPRIDSNRIGLLGRSLGGVIAVHTARTELPVKSLALWVPVFDITPWQKMLSAAEQSGEKIDAGALFHGRPPNPLFLKQLSGIQMREYLVDLAETPILHVSGGKDSRVSGEHTEAYKHVLQGRANSRFSELPEGDHDFLDPISESGAIRETTDWFKKTL